VKTLYVICEGQTEQRFIDQVLAPHLFNHGFIHVPTILVETGRRKGRSFRSGITSYARLRRTVVNAMKQRKQKDVFFTTMIDLYGLPRRFPGKASHKRNPANPYPFVKGLEREFAKDIDDKRFVPHLQLHEFETLLFVEPQAFAISFENCEAAIAELEGIVAEFPTVEHINDGKATAPSKRIIKVLQEYEDRKVDAGPDIAEFVGLDQIRQNCVHFDEWVKRLERL